MSILSKIVIILMIVIILVFSSFILFFTKLENEYLSEKSTPMVEILYPLNRTIVFDTLTIIGNASDDIYKLVDVQIKIDNDSWMKAKGTYNWSFTWNTSNISDGPYVIQVRAWDGVYYSVIENLTIFVENPMIKLSNEHKYALFIAADNFPSDNASKLGNGGLIIAEYIASYLIGNLSYSTSNVNILFDDGLYRSDNGYGKPISTLQQRPHQYAINYGGATAKSVVNAISDLINKSNSYQDSEVFIWIFGHGYGTDSRFAGGKILEQSAVFLWDALLTEKNLGTLLSGLNSKKTCIIIDACYSGGFADRTIFNLPELPTLFSGIAKPGRIVMTGESKFTPGYTITTTGPVFSQIWFYGITSGEADGFRPGLFHRGRPTVLGAFKDGKVSVEEAFYFTSYLLRTQSSLRTFRGMEPQINDEYPGRGLIRSMNGLIL